MSTSKKAMLLALAGSMVMSSAQAGSVAGNGGSTEITQVANNAQLAKTVAQNAQQITVEITTATNTLNTYMAALQNLQHLPAAAIAKMLAPYKDQVKDYAKLYKAVSGVYQTSKALQDAITQRQREMVALKKSPKEYLAAEIAFAQSQGDGSGKRIEEDLRKLGLFEKKAKELEDAQKDIPGNITGTVAGLESLNQQVIALRAENMETRSVILEQKVLAEQQYRDAALKKVENAQRNVEVTTEHEKRAEDAKRDTAVYKHPEFRFVW